MAHDIFHDAVRQGLIKDGWRITHEDMQLQVGGVEMFVDLAAEPLLAAEKEDQKIAVEVKSFVRVSDIHEFHLAIGQYRNYLLALSIRDPGRVLYLAYPKKHSIVFSHSSSSNKPCNLMQFIFSSTMHKRRKLFYGKNRSIPPIYS